MTQMTVRNPDFEAKVRSSFAGQGLMEHLGATMTRVEPGFVEIEAPFRDELSQQQGFFHGGGTTALVDSACGYAALTLMSADSEVLTIELKVNLSRLPMGTGSSPAAAWSAPGARSRCAMAMRMPSGPRARSTAPP